MSDGVIYKHSVEAFVQRVLLRRGLLVMQQVKGPKIRPRRAPSWSA
jgi:hypothetical protein